MKTFGLAGWSGSGKTTLVVKLLPELIGRGFRISTMKHTHHQFDMDKPGKDSHNHRMAGAEEVMVTSSTRWALLHELRGDPEPDIQTLIDRMSPVDLVLIEGFKSYPHNKLEVHRPSLGKPLLATEDPSVVAIATDEPFDHASLPVLDLDNAKEIVDFIVGHMKMVAETDHGAA
ncbi:MAG: molybdopterin-guanine dinucleotide biosynthesis protein B [Alphaproteobacteria bacterium]|nr:molybdopterin-guanine dinucleotide biosynthesis protein B [Alphaproteobacteria bacterium]